jgi:hypothetical protein
LSIRFAKKSALAICVTLACSGAVTLTTSVAQAKPPATKTAKQPIGVGAVTGPQGEKVRAKLLKMLRASGTYEVTDVEDVKPGASADTYRNMAQGTASDAIIVGNVSKALSLTLSVYGANGARIDSVTLKGGTFPKLFKAIDNEAEIAIADPLERARSGGAAQKATEPPPVPAGKPKLAPGDEEAEEAELIDESAKAKAKPKPAPKPEPKAEPKGKTKAKAGQGSDELESEDVDTTTGKPLDAEETDSGDAEDTPAEPRVHGLRPLELAAGVRGFTRNFAYTGRTTPGLIPYNLPFAPSVFLAGRFYPGALFNDGPLSHIGIQLRYELGLATTTNYEEGGTGGTPKIVRELKTNTSEFQVGVRGRLPIGKHELGVSAVYGSHSFTLSGDEKYGQVPYALVPDVHYHYVRIGLDARFYISKLIVGAQVSPRFLTSMDEIDKELIWFPGAKGSGLDFGLMLGWQLMPWLAPAVGFDVVRYGFDFNNLPVDPKPRIVAGGATDTFVSGWLGAIAHFDLAGGTSAGGTSVSATPDSSNDHAADEESAPEEPDEPPAKAASPAKPAKKAATPTKKAAPADEEEPDEEAPDE